MKLYDLSQPLNQDAPFWPFYPPFEVKYIKRKAEHGVNAQYIMSSNHMGTHLDAPRHFVTGGMTIDEIPIEWLWGDGVIVDLSDLDELDIFTPEDIEKRAEIREGDILFLHTGWHQYAQFGSAPDEEKYIHRHPGPHFSICDWLLEKKIHIWGVDMISTDHPMNLPIGRFLGAGGLEHWKKVRAQCEEKFGADQIDVLFPDSAYQLTHNALFPHNCMHVENLGGDIGLPELQNKRIKIGVFPWKFKGGEAAFCRAMAFVEEGQSEPAPAAPAVAAASPEADDLTKIKGIGPAFARRLGEGGISTFAALAAASADTIQEILQLREWQATTIDSWIEQAKEFITS